MKNIKRKGFTLVELLIVIVVIGILSAMMMLSSTEAVTSARASNIVSNLRNFKTAAMAMYVDYLDNMDAGNPPVSADWITADTFKDGAAITGNAVHDLLVKYMNKGDSNTGDADINHYHIIKGTMKSTVGGAEKTVTAYYVGYNNVNDSRIEQKLAGRAQSVGLLSTAEVNNTGTNSNAYSSGKAVYMFVTQASAVGNS